MFRCMGCMEEFDDSLDTCPHCGYKRGTPPYDAYDLPPETILAGQYIVGRRLLPGFGSMTLSARNFTGTFEGTSTPYLGWDGLAKCKVVIREYMPDCAKRVPGKPNVFPFRESSQERYKNGRRRFINNVHLLKKLKNEKNIVHVENVFTENNTVYIVLQYLEGETLQDLLRREKKIPYQQAANYMVQILSALQKLHACGVLHRNINPASILLTKDQAMLCDFKAMCPVGYKNADVILCTVGYSPREQFTHTRKQDTTCDIYACCATLYRAITGIVPEDALERCGSEPDPLQPPSALGIELPQSAENAILNGMNLHPENRVQTAEELIEALRGQKPVRRIYETKSTTRKNRFLHHFFPNRRI